MNSAPFNSIQFNNSAPLSMPAMGDNVVFNGFSLQNTEVISSRVLDDSMPVRDLQTVGVPRGHGQITNGDFWRKRLIEIEGTLITDTNQELEDLKDDMKKNLAVQKGNLDIKHGDSVRRYVATLIKSEGIFESIEHFNITWAKFSLVFQCDDPPFGQDTFDSDITFLSKTALSLPETIVNSGTAPTKPIITFVFSAAVGVSGLSFQNMTTGEEISVPGPGGSITISAGDVIQFDSRNKRVLVNGSAVDYTGVFPDLSAGSNSILVEVTGTSATYTFTAKFKQQYL